MNLAHIDFNEFLQQKEPDALTPHLLRLLYLQKGEDAMFEMISLLLVKPTLITLSIEATDLEGSTKIKHTVQFVSNTLHQE
jgi:hypothetical protein